MTSPIGPKNTYFVTFFKTFILYGFCLYFIFLPMPSLIEYDKPFFLWILWQARHAASTIGHSSKTIAFPLYRDKLCSRRAGIKTPFYDGYKIDTAICFLLDLKIFLKPLNIAISDPGDAKNWINSLYFLCPFEPILSPQCPYFDHLVKIFMFFLDPAFLTTRHFFINLLFHWQNCFSDVGYLVFAVLGAFLHSSK